MSVTHTITGSNFLTGNPIQITITASDTRTSHKLALKVTCKSMGNIELQGSPYIEEIAPNNRISVFEISGLVDFPAEYKFSYPPVGAVTENDVTHKISFDIGEVWTDDQGERQEEWTTPAENTFKVIKGRLRAHELALLNDQNKTFDSEFVQGGKFLTHQPNMQRVSPSHIPMLWYHGRWFGSHSISIHLKIAFIDGEPVTLNQDHTIWDITALVGFVFSPRHWDYYVGMDSNIASYEFWVSDSGGDISEHRTYIVDHKNYEQSFTFFYTNPLSGIDMLWLTGEYTQGLKSESETAFRPVPIGSGSKVASIKTVSVIGQRSWEINTGFKTRQELLAMRDFIESRERWMVDPENNNCLLPVMIESGEFSLYDSMEDLQNLELQILEAHR